MAESFDVNVGVRQGDALSVILFKLVLEYIIRKLYIRGSMSTVMVQVNAFADNVVIISRNLECERLQELDNTAQEMGL